MLLVRKSCNNQISGAIDIYVQAAELAPNFAIAQNLSLLKTAQRALPVPGPQEVHPSPLSSRCLLV